MANDSEEKQPPKTPPDAPASKDEAGISASQTDSGSKHSDPTVPQSVVPADAESRRVAAKETGASDVGAVPHGAEDTARPAAEAQAKQTAAEAAKTSGVPPKPAAPAADAAPKPAEPAAAPPKPAAPAGDPPKPAAPAAAGAVPPKPAAPSAPAAAKPAAPTGAAVPPRPAAPKEAPPKPEPLDNPLVQRFKKRFGAAIREAWIDRKQAILVVDAAQLEEITLYARDEEKFNYLADLTAVDWPHREKRFDLIMILYSFEKNERLRIKAHVGEGELVASVTNVWPVANWLEREAFDMFGILFSGHPELKRILLPDEWQGFPLRKEYDILTQDTAWIRENLGIESGQ
ncbi:MAG TPA: NADH-quinone oxidoreductase subunit C [Candidatus Acidoferrales bacterium]|nr:NADH-quinone oxidoreductase subunit C [Candidatus Acidoferrales bacterium]